MTPVHSDSEIRERELFLGGTKRAVPPEVTFARIQKYLQRFGITRLADITGLDCLGVPVYTALRPRGRQLQASQGKGVRAIDAKVSALMECLELSFAEDPVHEFVQASARELERAGKAPVEVPRLPEFRTAACWSPGTRLPWVEGEELISGRSCMLPAAAVYFISSSLLSRTSNGLASGNDVIEATLHALYEVYERDATSQLVDEGGGVSFEPCDVIAPESISVPVLDGTLDKLRKAAVGLRLFRIGIESVIHTFVAVLLDDNPLAHSSQVSLGFGAHLSPTIAASRALTEAAQSRLTYIHASREDLTERSYREKHDQLADWFRGFDADTSWDELDDASRDTMSGDLDAVIAQFRAEGSTQIFRHTLTGPDDDIAVVKVLVPGARDEFPY